MAFHVYMLRGADGSYDVGRAEDINARLAAHQSGANPGYTAKRLPVTLVWNDWFQTRLDALERERQIKGRTRAKKEALIAHDWDRIVALSKARS